MSEDQSKIIRIPISYKQRKLNENGIGYVPCEISSRWLQFNSVSDIVGGRELVMVNAMTIGKDDYPYKLFEMILDMDDLRRIVTEVKPIKTNE